MGLTRDLTDGPVGADGQRMGAPWRLASERKVVGIEIESYSDRFRPTTNPEAQGAREAGATSLNLAALLLQQETFPPALWTEYFDSGGPGGGADSARARARASNRAKKRRRLLDGDDADPAAANDEESEASADEDEDFDFEDEDEDDHQDYDHNYFDNGEGDDDDSGGEGGEGELGLRVTRSAALTSLSQTRAGDTTTSGCWGLVDILYYYSDASRVATLLDQIVHSRVSVPMAEFHHTNIAPGSPTGALTITVQALNPHSERK